MYLKVTECQLEEGSPARPREPEWGTAVKGAEQKESGDEYDL